MIRDVFTLILNLFKENDGLDKKIVNDSNNSEMLRIIEIILSECRCSIIDKNGNYARFGSSTDIRIIKMLIQIFLSNVKEIPPEIVSMALTKEGVLGPFKSLNFNKIYNEDTNLYDIEIENIFPNEFNVNIFKSDSEFRKKFIDEILQTYVKEIIYENEELENKYPLGKFISKKMSKLKTDEELLDDLTKILKDTLNIDENLVKNIANYILINIMKNKYFKTELINRTINTTKLQELGKVRAGFNSLVDNMSLEVLEMLELRNFPYGEFISIKDTYYTVVSVLKALSLNFENMDVSEILDNIEIINRNFGRKNRKVSEINYRNENVKVEKYGYVMNTVDFRNIEKALNNVCIMIKTLLIKKNEIDFETYVKEVIRIHYRFLRIQPFKHSNGRTARMLVNILLQNKGVLGIFRKENRNVYYEAINDANKIIEVNEESYLKGLADNPMMCVEMENEFLSKKLPFFVIKY